MRFFTQDVSIKTSQLNVLRECCNWVAASRYNQWTPEQFEPLMYTGKPRGNIREVDLGDEMVSAKFDRDTIYFSYRKLDRVQNCKWETTCRIKYRKGECLLHIEGHVITLGEEVMTSPPRLWLFIKNAINSKQQVAA